MRTLRNPMTIKQKVKAILPNDPLANNTRVRSVVDEVPEGASVLDIGCVNHTLDDDDHNWLHGQLQEVTNDIVGIDFLEDEIRKMQEMGYQAEHADAEAFSLDRVFDVIVAGELIEHLSNPGQFLDRVHEHLDDDGQLILTTPNPWYLFHVLAVYAGIAQWNEEHTTWYDHIVLTELLGRHGFKIEGLKYVRPSPWKWMFIHKNIERGLTYPFWALKGKRIGGNRYLIVARKDDY